MQTTITAKLKLVTTPQQFQALRQTQLAYRDALNYVSAYSFAHGKTGSVRRLQTALYGEVRGQFGVPAQMACSILRQVGATYRGLWTKWRKNREARAAGYTKRRFKGLDHAPRYVSPTMTYVYEHDYSLKTDQRVSLLTLAGRIVVPYQGWHRHVALLRETAEIGEAKLWYDQRKKHFYLLVALTLETPDPAPDGYEQVVGIDVGQRYLATVTTPQNQSQFYSGKETRQKTDHVARLQKRLRKKGTRSATRTRIRLSRRERRLKQQTNHAMSKHILDTHPHSLIGLEDLTGIPPFEASAEAAIAPETKIKQAMAFLRAHLMSGPRPASEMEVLAAASGFTSTTLYKARRRAGVGSKRQGKQWIWQLAAQRKAAKRAKVPV